MEYKVRAKEHLQDRFKSFNFPTLNVDENEVLIFQYIIFILPKNDIHEYSIGKYEYKFTILSRESWSQSRSAAIIYIIPKMMSDSSNRVSIVSLALAINPFL